MGRYRPENPGRRSARSKGECSMLKLKKAYALAVIFTLGLAFALVPRAAADNDGKISGAVIDFDGKPWSGLGVKIKGEQGVTQDTKTDEEGKFAFVNLRA